jgi:hypothetical protein
MKNSNFRFTWMLAGIMLLPISSNPPYLDPGSGSFILQMLIAGAAGAIFIMRSQIARFFGFFRKKKDEEKQSDSTKPKRNAK